ncbi:MAG TPA: GGDEF domain-containing protein [Acidimicrobiia bacterium]
MGTEVREAIPASSRPEVRRRRRWPWGSVSTDTSPVHHEMSSHRQVQLLWLVTGIMFVAVAATAPLVMRDARNDVHIATSRLVPASTALATAMRNYSDGLQELVVLVGTDPGARGNGITLLSTLNVAADTAWKNYTHFAANLPGEAKLQTQVRLEVSQLYATGATLLTTPTNSAAAVATVSALGAAQRKAMDRIQSLYQTRISAMVTHVNDDFGASQRDLLIVSAFAFIIMMTGFALSVRTVRRRGQVQADEGRRNDLESGLQRALEMARTEDDCYRLVQNAVERSSTTLSSELLVADSSRAHFHQVASTGPAGGPGCPVMSPDDCPSTNRGQTQTWSTSGALDTCPHLRDRDTGPCSAVCVPVSIAGKTIGVVHAIGPDHHPPDGSTTADLELIARKSGERIGILRAFSRTEAQARTDPLTGLLNRRSLETAVRDLAAEAHTYAIAYGDLDHFKLLNDIHGHDAGDRALRLFARVLRDNVRPNDIAARYGGEEFVVVLPDCTVADAYVVIDRVRTRLADAQRGGTVPSFTVSFGLAPGEADLAFGEIVEQADVALLRAKSEGRDRVVLAGNRDEAPDAAPQPASELRPLS